MLPFDQLTRRRGAIAQQVALGVAGDRIDGRRGIGSDALLRGTRETRQRGVGERHLAAHFAPGRLPFGCDRLRQRFGFDAQHATAGQVHRLAVQQYPVALGRWLDGCDLPEALHGNSRFSRLPGFGSFNLG